MPINPMYFQPLSFQQAAPFVSGMQAGTQIGSEDVENYLRGLQAQQTQIQNQYLPQKFETGIQHEQLANAFQQLQNQYFPQETMARIGLEKAQAGQAGAESGLLGTEAAKNRFMLNNPGFMVPGMAGQLAGLAWLQKNQPELLGGPQPSTTASSSIPSSPDNSNGGLPGLGSSASTGIASTGSPVLDLYRQMLMITNPGAAAAMARAQKDLSTTSNVTQWNKTLNESAENSQEATQAINALNQFKSAYDRSTYKGPFKGNIPSTGFEAGLVPGNLTAEQEADNAANNMIATIGKQIISGRLTNADIQVFLPKLKLNRTLTPEAVNDLYSFMLPAQQRNAQENQFMLAARDKGLDAQTAASQWKRYNLENPVYDFKNQKANDYVDWSPYLDKNYQKQQSNISPSVKNYSDEAIQHTAKKYGMSIDQVKQKLGVG